MSHVPIMVAACLGLATVGLVRIEGWPPFLAVAVIGGTALAFLSLLAGTALMLLPMERRRHFLRAVWAVTHRDLKDLLGVLMFRK